MFFNKIWELCTDLTGRDFFHFIDKYYTNQLSNSHMTWDFQEDTHVQDGKWQVNFFKIYLFYFFFKIRWNSSKILYFPLNLLKYIKNSLYLL